MSTSTPKRIVFDFGGVVFRWRPAVLIRQVWPHHAPDQDRAEHWVQQVFQGYTGDWGEFDRGTVDAPELARRIAARTGLTETELHQLIEAAPAELAPIPASVDLLERLHARGATLHYLSNMPAPFAAHLSRSHGFMQRFRSGVYSSRVQLIKPDPAIFAHAAAHFGAEPDELVFLDDHPPNIAAARAAGWQGIHFQDAAQAEREIRAAGWWPQPGTA
ncbi:HAD family hydrolase [Aquabacterium sp.]|uniref:HAD family hydrolase n=1 Tax=Aquabacterium sp. TaxID=1872578 RepID=UPI00378432E0